MIRYHIVDQAYNELVYLVTGVKDIPRLQEMRLDTNKMDGVNHNILFKMRMDREMKMDTWSRA